MNTKKIFFKVLALVLLSISSFTVYAKNEKAIDNNPSNIILILGSDDLATLQYRVETGLKLYQSAPNKFDYVIVSGGCGAHKSKICEATEMASLLVEGGVEANKVVKEEKSQNTVQNYVYSRMLKKSDGSKYINAGDSLYVVSNHWHAISVAARFNTYDKVNAVYHIEGAIIPKKEDKVDYVNIFYKNDDNDDFVKSALWPTVNASFSIYDAKKKKAPIFNYLFVGDSLVVQSLNDATNRPILLSSDIASALPENWKNEIDASFYHPVEKNVYLFKQNEYITISINKKKKMSAPQPITQWIVNLPTNWQSGHIDAAYYNTASKNVVLLKGDEYLEVAKNKIDNHWPRKIKETINNWPFVWGDGDIDAAHYNALENKIYLYRGKQYIRMDIHNTIEDDSPQKITIE